VKNKYFFFIPSLPITIHYSWNNIHSPHAEIYKDSIPHKYVMIYYEEKDTSIL